MDHMYPSVSVYFILFSYKSVSINWFIQKIDLNWFIKNVDIMNFQTEKPFRLWLMLLTLYMH
jgi:hypothetical protein